MSDYINTESSFDIHVAAEEIIEDNLGNSNESDFIELSDIAPQGNTSLTNLAPREELDILDLDQIPPINVENVFEQKSEFIPESETKALNIFIGDEDQFNTNNGDYASQFSTFNDQFEQNVVVEHIEMPSSSTPLIEPVSNIPEIRQKRKYTRRQKVQPDNSLDSVPTPITRRRGRKPLEKSPVVDPPAKRSKRQGKNPLNKALVIDEPNTEETILASEVKPKRGRGRPKANTSDKIDTNIQNTNSTILDDTTAKVVTRGKGRSRQNIEINNSIVEDSIELDYSTLYEDDSSDQVLGNEFKNEITDSQPKRSRGRKKKTDTFERKTETEKEVIGKKVLNKEEEQRQLPTQETPFKRNSRRKKKLTNNTTDNLTISNLEAHDKIIRNEKIPEIEEPNLIETEVTNVSADKTLEITTKIEQGGIPSDEMDIETEIKESLIITNNSIVVNKDIIPDDNSDGDDISLSKLKEKSFIEKTEDDNLLQTGSNINKDINKLLNNTEKENDNLLEEMSSSPSKRIPKQPIMIDFEYNIDKVILEKKYLCQNKEAFEATSSNASTDGRSLRRKARTKHYEEDSDEDPYSKIELSESDSEMRPRKGRKYDYDDEYLPWKKEASLSSDSAVEAYDHLENKYRKKKLTKKKCNIENLNDVNNLPENETKILDTKCENSTSVITIPDDTSSGLHNILGDKTLGAGLQIKKISSQNGGKLDIPILDPNKEKKTIEISTQTNTISTQSSSSQTSNMTLLKLNNNKILSKDETENACNFLKRIINTTSELGQLMCQKSVEFVDKKINSTYIKDTARVDYCIQKSFLLFKLAKDNLTSMEENLQKEYESFLEENNLMSSFETEKKVTPQNSNHDSDCEIVEEPITVKKPKFNPKTVFLNKELSIKMAKKPVQTKQLKKNKSFNVTGGQHEVWINDSIMVKKVKPQKSFLAQDSRCKKPPDYVTENAVKDFFDNYYGIQSLCAPFTSLEWFNLSKQNEIICNHFCLEKLANYAGSSDFEDSGSEDDVCYDINTSTEHLLREFNHSENSLNLFDKTDEIVKVIRNPKSLVTLCIKYLNNNYIKINKRKIVPKHAHNNIKVRKPKSLIQLSISAICNKNNGLSDISFNNEGIQSPKSLFNLCISKLNYCLKSSSIKSNVKKSRRINKPKSLLELSINTINLHNINSNQHCESDCYEIIHKNPKTLLQLSLHEVINFNNITLNQQCESQYYEINIKKPKSLLQLSLQKVINVNRYYNGNDFIKPIINDKAIQLINEESLIQTKSANKDVSNQNLNMSLKYICYITILKLFNMKLNIIQNIGSSKDFIEPISKDISVDEAMQLDHKESITNDSTCIYADYLVSNMSLKYICYKRILNLLSMEQFISNQNNEDLIQPILHDILLNKRMQSYKEETLAKSITNENFNDLQLNISLKHICYEKILNILSMKPINNKILHFTEHIDLEKEKISDNNDKTSMPSTQQATKSLLSLCLNIVQSSSILNNDKSCLNIYNNLPSLSSIAHESLVRHMYDNNESNLNCDINKSILSISTVSNEVKSLLDTCLEAIQRNMCDQNRISPPCMSIDDIFINNINSISQEEFSEAEHDEIADNDNFADSDNDQYDDNDSDSGWDAQIQLRELKSCLGPIIQNVHTQASNDVLQNVNAEVSISNDNENVDKDGNNIRLNPMQVKTEPLEEFFENDTPTIKEEPIENEIVQNQPPSILLKTEMMNQHLESYEANRNHLNEDESAIDLFEKFLRSNPVAQSVIAGSNTPILTPSNFKIRRQYEPDSDGDSQCQLDMGLLVPHSSEPMKTDSAKNNLMEIWTDDEESSSQINKKTQEKNKRKKLKKKKNIEIIDSLKQGKSNIEKDQLNNKQVEVLTKSMRYKLRKSGLEEKESTESEDDNLSVLKSDTKAVEVTTKNAALPKFRLLRSSAKDNEIQCNSVDSTQKIDIKTKTGKNLKTKLSGLKHQELVTSEKQTKDSKVINVPPFNTETENTNLINNDFGHCFDKTVETVPFNVEIKELNTVSPLNNEKSVEISIDIENKVKPKSEDYTERDGWHCYKINKDESKLYQYSYIPLHKLPEAFVEIYMKYNQISDNAQDENDAEINRLTDLSNLRRQSSVRVKPQITKENVKSNEKPKQENVNSPVGQNDTSELDNCDELEPSDDELNVETECLPPVDDSENRLAKNLLIQDNDSDNDIPLSQIKQEPKQERQFMSGPKSKRTCMTKSVVSSQSLVLTVDKMMKKEIELLHAPVVLDKEIVEEKVDTKTIFKNKLQIPKKEKRRKATPQGGDDSSSEEEKRWVSTKTKLIKRMEKNIRDSAGIDDVKRARLVTDFLRKHGGLGRSVIRKRGYKISRKRLLEREKQLRVLSQELFGAPSNAIPGKKGSGSFFKGRRNIRKVIDKKSLAKSTVLANMEEFERKKRLNFLQNKLRELLGYEENVQAVVINNELCLEYDFEESQPLVSVHPFFTKVMKAHQCEGVKFLWDACFESLEYASSGHRGGGCILAHCMGLGKTLQVLALLHTVLTHPRSGVRRVLVCCPLSTVLNWVDEIHKWLGPVTDQIKPAKARRKLQVFELSKLKKTYERAYQLEDWYNGGGIFIIGYELFRSLSTLDPILDDVRPTIVNKIRTALLDPGPDIVVCDEGHLLKNDSSVLAIAMSRVKTKRRIVLTGTPMQNNLREYYCMVNFVKPNLLGTYSEYSNRFENPIMNGQHRDSSDADIKLMKTRTHILHKVLEGCLQRQEASVLYPYLPTKHEYTVFITLTKWQTNLYKHYLQKFAKRLKQNILKDFHTLQKIWSHPQVLHNFLMKGREDNSIVKDEKCEDDLAREDLASERDVKPAIGEMWWMEHLDNGNMLDTLETSNKFRAVFNILHECVQVNDKVLLFSTSLFTLDTLEYFLKKINIWTLGQEYYRLDGSVPPEVRQKWCREFNSENNLKTKLFLISTRAGSLGLNLTAANRVILFDTSWNPAHDIQSIFRVYRFGQKKDCYIYRLVAMGTMEQKIYERSVSKQAVACRVVDEQQIERHYSMGELTELYRFDEACYRVASGVAPGVRDVVLLRVARDLPALHAVHEHDSLLRDADQHLPEHERNEAWDQFQREQSHKQMQCAPKIKRNVAKRCSIEDQQKHKHPNKTVEGPDEIKTEIPVIKDTGCTAPQAKRKRGRPKAVDTAPVVQKDHTIEKIENNDDLVVKISDVLIKHNFHTQLGSTPVSNIALAVSQLINSSDILQNPEGENLDLSERITKALENYTITTNNDAELNAQPNKEHELITSDPIVNKDDSMVALPNSIKRKFDAIENPHTENITNKKQKKKKKKNKEKSQTIDDNKSIINSQGRTKRKAAISAEKYMEKFKHLPEWTAVDDDDLDYDADIIEDAGAVIDDIVDDMDEEIAPVKQPEPVPTKVKSTSGPASRRKTKNIIREEEPLVIEPLVKTKPRIGPKSKVKKPSEVPEEILPQKKLSKPTKKKDEPSPEADIVILSDDDDEPIKKEYNIKVMPQSRLMPCSTADVAVEDIKKETVTPIPLNPEILKNHNFIYIAAHIYQKRNPDLDDQSARLAAEYSIKKELDKISKTNKPLCEGPIYDIALQMLGRSTIEALWKTASQSLDGSVSTVDLPFPSTSNSIAPPETPTPQPKAPESINIDIEITEKTPDLLYNAQLKDLLNQPRIMPRESNKVSKVAKNLAATKAKPITIKKPPTTTMKTLSEFAVTKPDTNVVPIKLIKANFSDAKREESILPDDDDDVRLTSSPGPLPAAPLIGVPPDNTPPGFPRPHGIITLSPSHGVPAISIIPQQSIRGQTINKPIVNNLNQASTTTICLDSDEEIDAAPAPAPAPSSMQLGATAAPIIVNQTTNPDVFNSLIAQFAIPANKPGGKLLIFPTASLNLNSGQPTPNQAPTPAPNSPPAARKILSKNKKQPPKMIKKVVKEKYKETAPPETPTTPSFILKSQTINGKMIYTLLPPKESVPAPDNKMIYLDSDEEDAPAPVSARPSTPTPVSITSRTIPCAPVPVPAHPNTPTPVRITSRTIPCAPVPVPARPSTPTAVRITSRAKPCAPAKARSPSPARAPAPVPAPELGHLAAEVTDDPLDIFKNVVHIQAADYKPPQTTFPTVGSKKLPHKRSLRSAATGKKPEGVMLGTVDLTRDKIPSSKPLAPSKAAPSKAAPSKAATSSKAFSGSSSLIMITSSGKVLKKDSPVKPQTASTSKSNVVYMDNVKMTPGSSKTSGVATKSKYKPKDTKLKLNVPMALKDFSLDDLEDIIELE